MADPSVFSTTSEAAPPASGRAWVALLPRLRRFARSLTGNPFDADDLVQSAAERVIEKGIPDDADARNWMYRVVRNLWIDEVRGRAVRARHVDDPGQTDVEAIGADPGNDRKRALDEAMRAMQQLAVEQREVLALVALEGFTYAEAAALLEVPRGTVMSRLARARSRLAELLAE